jgi:hypothetical protein
MAFGYYWYVTASKFKAWTSVMLNDSLNLCNLECSMW